LDNKKIYKKYFIEKKFERVGLFKAIKSKYGCKSALYPGSFIHITPSFIFPHVIYVDTDSQAKKFFKDIGQVKKIIQSRKLYDQESNVDFFSQSYAKSLDIPEESIDLLISQYAGFISLHCKKYLKHGGILLVNNSHGDASMARLDDDYNFVAVVKKQGDNYRISGKDLDSYFIPKKPVNITRSYLEKIQKGIGYTRPASSYIFRKEHKI
jgi:hypothetical protein